MYFPEGLKKRGEGAGALFVGGAAIMSLIFGAAAFGWIGVAIGAAGLVLLLFAEVYREAALLSREREKLKEDLQSAQVRERSVHELKLEKENLELTVDDLRRKLRKPSLDPGHLLLGIKAYLDQIELVRRHRELQSQVKDALVTEIEISQRKVTVSAICPEGAEKLDQQPVAFVDTHSHQTYGGGLVIYAASQDVRAVFDLTELPVDLADVLRSDGAVSPKGFVLRLLGGCLDDYRELDDQTLREADEVLSRAREAITAVLLPQTSRDSSDLLRELESELGPEDGVNFKGDGEERATPNDWQGDGS